MQALGPGFGWWLARLALTILANQPVQSEYSHQQGYHDRSTFLTDGYVHSDNHSLQSPYILVDQDILTVGFGQASRLH
jgi:hypothetical protein